MTIVKILSQKHSAGSFIRHYVTCQLLNMFPNNYFDKHNDIILHWITSNRSRYKTNRKGILSKFIYFFNTQDVLNIFLKFIQS